jgi:hypothetical protein
MFELGARVTSKHITNCRAVDQPLGDTLYAMSLDILTAADNACDQGRLIRESGWGAFVHAQRNPSMSRHADRYIAITEGM